MNPSRLLRLLLPVALALGQAAAGASVVGEAARPGLETIAAGIRGPASTVGRSGPVRSTGHASFLSRGVMAAGLAQQPQRFLGYEIEEERRYVLGPDDSARRDTGFWSIRLAEIFEVDGEPEALFTLIHEWAAPPVLGDPVLGQIRNVNSEGEVRVNVHGFPLMIRVQTTRHLAGMGEEAYTVEYVLEDENRRYEKRTTRAGERWYQGIRIRRHDSVDFDAPAGLFAFLPRAPGCLDSPVLRYDQAGGTYLQPRSAGSGASPTATMPNTLKVADNADCEESMFAHPGLLSLAMPALWEAQGERAYVFFTPLGPYGEPETRVGLGSRGAPLGPVGMPQPGAMNRGLGPDPRRLEGPPLSPTSYHETETLTFIERVSVGVGARTIDAWRIDVSGGYGPIYVDDDGGVVRIDLRPTGGADERYIRKLWPSEF